MSCEIYLCADDYAQNEGISRGIEQLAEEQRINAISCMVNTPTWETRASRLEAYAASCYVGLHLNLTEGAPLSQAWVDQYGKSFKPLSWLIMMCFSKQLDKQVVALELDKQLDAFIAKTGCLPDFIDGHQHVHQFPVIREHLMAKHHANPQLRFRNTSPGHKAGHVFDGFPKKHMIAYLGGSRFNQTLSEKQAMLNTSFSGVYNFKQAKNYQQYFIQFLKNSTSHGLIMCHPGHDINDKTDPLYLSRDHEFDYLMSDVYLDNMRAMDCVLIKKS
ncbi:MAG: ChbG/HpnK family deacetylase [Legionellaceae bacterium]|nr:ChbG/HpnK family deacetylase [Legionellaceae bacterium]